MINREMSSFPKRLADKKALRRRKSISRRAFVKAAAGTAAFVGIAVATPLSSAFADSKNKTPSLKYKGKITPAERKAAAARVKSAGLNQGVAAAALNPLGVPHYFGPYPNYANSPLPSGAVTSISLTSGGTRYIAPIITIRDVYGKGTGATATATVVGGVITNITVTSGGSGYYAPVVEITDATGINAAATATIGGTLTGGMRKFVDSLPGAGPSRVNNLGQYIPVAVADTTTYPGCDYYEIALVEYREQMHSDLPPVVGGKTNPAATGGTKLRGYVQEKNGVALDQPHYLGPIIVAKRDRPVRIKFTNRLPVGAGGNLFIPVDTTVMGSGEGPIDIPESPGMKENYTQNRASVHLHGGFVPWISDGTPHQWTTPPGETTSYPKGVSVQYVPDMWFVNGNVVPNTVGKTTPPVAGATNDPSPGSLTFYYNNQQSARLQFYHDHAYGITRLNVYVGEAAPYVITDQVEQDLIKGTNVSGVNPNRRIVLPDIGFPLVIQDKTFVDPNTIDFQDPTWNWGTTPGTPTAGDLWYPHVYMPNQNPWDLDGMNAYGRWHYGPWFWPPTTNIAHGPVPNPYYDPVNAPWEPPMIPGTPNPSTPGEAFMDTPIINGTAYPYMEVDPKPYRFRILNVCDDRFLNLQLYVADPTITTADGRTNTEVRMVPACATPDFPEGWPADGREGGVPDPTTAGPAFIQIGTEGGFLPAPVVVPNQPIDWNLDPTTFNFGNVSSHAILIGTAERADVIVDFTPFAGKTLILYNDAPAAFPARDPRYDYYTYSPDNTETGGTPTTQPGYGPNTRTIMQIRVRGTPSATPPPPPNWYDPAALAALEEVFAKTNTKRGVFEVSQDPIIVPNANYNSAYNKTFPIDTYVRIHEKSKTFQTISGTTLTIPMQPKAIQDEMGEAFDIEYGRMSAMLGLELPNTVAGAMNFMLYGYASPPVDLLKDSVALSEPLPGDGTQIWMITHNGVDTHTIHFHLYNVQMINRVAWDNAVILPDPNELGWKETIRVNPLENIIVAMRPILPKQTFKLPNSIRLMDVTKPEGALLNAGGITGTFDPNGQPVTIYNHPVNFGHEYVYHCHLLAHEEMDMMHSLVFAVAPEAPSNLVATLTSGRAVLTWKDNSINETGFTIQRANDQGFTAGLVTFKVGPNVTTYTDTTVRSNQAYYYRVQANNVVGDTWDYSYQDSAGFPNFSVDSPFSNIVTLGQGGPVTLPAAPTNLRATSVTDDSVALAWNDNSNNESGFLIQRADSALNLTTFSVGADVNTFTDTTVAPNTRYYYRVRAFNSRGNSAFSNIITVTTEL